MQDFTLGMVTLKVPKGDAAPNLDTVAEYAARAKNEGIDLLVFPEFMLQGYIKDRARYADIAADADGPVIGRLRQIAGDHGLAISAGFIESAGGLYYNSQALMDGQGGLVGVHRKCNLSPSESPYFAAGTKYSVLDLGFCRVGYTVCFEAWFPESQRVLALAGAELILMPFAFAVRWERFCHKPPAGTEAEIVAARRTRLNRFFQGASFANGLFMAYIDHCGQEADEDPESRVTYPGVNIAWNPLGDVLAESPGYQEGLTAVRMQAADMESWRSNDHFPIHWRKPSLYGALVEPLTDGDIEVQKDYYRAHNAEYLDRYDRGV